MASSPWRPVARFGRCGRAPTRACCAPYPAYASSLPSARSPGQLSRDHSSVCPERQGRAVPLLSVHCVALVGLVGTGLEHFVVLAVAWEGVHVAQVVVSVVREVVSVVREVVSVVWVVASDAREVVLVARLVVPAVVDQVVVVSLVLV